MQQNNEERARKQGRDVQLTQRELDVLQLLVQGKTHREIAADLHISRHTAREYIARIYSKLNVSRRSACVVKAIAMGIRPD